jgi:predicted alpha/beta hydrolase
MIEQVEETVKAEDGWILGYRYWKAPESRATLLFFPAMGASTRSLMPMAQALAERNITVVLADPRGIGMSLPRPSRDVDFGMHDHLDYDWPAFVSRAKEIGGEKPLYIGGHSLGAQLSALYVGQQPDQVAGLLSIAGCALYYRHWDLHARPVIFFVYVLFSLLARIFGYLPGQYVGWGRPCGATLTKVWSVWGLTGLYTKRDGSSAEECFENYQGPALFLSFTDDIHYAPKAAVDALAKRFRHAEVTRWHKDPKELNVEEIGHFKWRQCAPVWQLIADWISKQGRLEEIAEA